MPGHQSGSTALMLSTKSTENAELLLDMGAAVNDRDKVSWLSAYKGYLLCPLNRYIGGDGGL